MMIVEKLILASDPKIVIFNKFPLFLKRIRFHSRPELVYPKNHEQFQNICLTYSNKIAEIPAKYSEYDENNFRMFYVTSQHYYCSFCPNEKIFCPNEKYVQM